jgi:histidine triad (HIT) family protein
VPADIVTDEPHALAFLDKSPLFIGHVLVVPRSHVVTLTDLPENDVPAFFRTVQRLDRAVETAMGSDGSLVLNNNVISESVPHMHVHVIPRNKGDGLRFWLGPRGKYAEGQSGETARLIAAAYAETGQ